MSSLRREMTNLSLFFSILPLTQLFTHSTGIGPGLNTAPFWLIRTWLKLTHRQFDLIGDSV